MSITLILIIVAGILALLDLILGLPQIGRRTWFLTPLAVLLIVIALLLAGGSIHA